MTRQGTAMVWGNDYSGVDGDLTTQALVELTEANLPATSSEAEWAEELAYLHRSAQSDSAPSQEVDELIDLSTLLA